MPRRPPKTCSQPGCPNLVLDGGSQCEVHRAESRRLSDQRRGTSTQRGYGQKHRERFRAEVLRRDPLCVLCKERPSSRADHYPLSRRELEERGLDPNDPSRGRGLCASCDSKQTARRPGQQGGWNRRSV